MTVKLGPHALYCDPGPWLGVASTVKLCYDLQPAAVIPPGPLVVGRPEENFIGQHPMGSGDATALGSEFARTIYAPLVKLFPRVDVWEGPNECNPAGYAEMVWYAQFLAEFARQVYLMGKRAAIGSFATGCPELEMWKYYVPALRACRDYGAIHARHCYGTLDVWNAYRFEQDHAIFLGLGFDPPMLLTECGQDAPNPPWRKLYGGDMGRYFAEWIKPFTLRVNQSPYVLGAHLFTWGDGHAQAWRPFDVSGTGLENILRTDADIQLKETEPVYIATLIAESDGAEAHQAFIAFHRWISEHNGSPRGFQWPEAGWPSAPFTCRAGPALRWYHAPTDAAPYRTTADRRELGVLQKQGEWFQVLAAPEIWVRAEDCVALNA